MAIGALASVGGLFALIVAGFLALANWAERDLQAYPFKNEDWLRYLLPSKFAAQDRTRLMLIGPSTVRENLRYEQFAAAFPEFDVVQGGISLGTIADASLALEYVRRVYGEEALPDFMVLGISPRFIADIPDVRPFGPGITNYSPHFGVAETGSGLELIPKHRLAGIASTLRFLGKKQPSRFRIALAAVLHHWLSESQRALGVLDGLRRTELAAILNRARGFGRPPDVSYLDQLSHRISPYKYTRFPAVPTGTLETWLNSSHDSNWWQQVFAWDAAADLAARRRIEKLVGFAAENGIRLLLVNMPERKAARDLYHIDYRHYLGLVEGAAGDFPFVNLREFLETSEFYDAEHSNDKGSLRLTDEIIKLVRAKLTCDQSENSGGCE